MEGDDVIAVGPSSGGVPTIEVSQWTNWSWTQSIRDADSLTLTGVPGDHPAAVSLVEGYTDLWLIRRGVILFRGRIMNGSDALTPDGSAEVNVAAVDYRGLLKRRVLLRPKVYTAVEQAEIAWDLVNEVQTYLPAPYTPNTFGITSGVLPTGRLRDRTYEPGAFVGDLIDDLAAVIDGFEWRVTPELVLEIGSPRIGQWRDETLDFGGYLNSINRSVSTDAFACGIWYSGGQGTTPVYMQAPGHVVPAGALLEASFSDPDLSIQQTISDKAENAAAEMCDLRRTYSAVVSPGRWEPGIVDVGDSAHLVVNHGRMQLIDQPVRVVEQTLAVNADEQETVTVTLVEDDAP